MMTSHRDMQAVSLGPKAAMDDSCYHLCRQAAVSQVCVLRPDQDGWCGVQYYLRYPNLRMVDGAKGYDRKVGEDDSGCGNGGGGSSGYGDGCSNRSSSADSSHSSMECSNSHMGDTNSRMATPIRSTSYR